MEETQKDKVDIFSKDFIKEVDSCWSEHYAKKATEINKSIELPELSEAYIKEIEGSWLTHFEKEEQETVPLGEFIFSNILKYLLDDLIKKYNILTEDRCNYKIFCNSKVLFSIKDELKEKKYKGFLLKLSDVLPDPFYMFITRIQ
jgi:hypothetical protein